MSSKIVAVILAVIFLTGFAFGRWTSDLFPSERNIAEMPAEKIDRIDAMIGNLNDVKSFTKTTLSDKSVIAWNYSKDHFSGYIMVKSVVAFQKEKVEVALLERAEMKQSQRHPNIVPGNYTRELAYRTETIDENRLFITLASIEYVNDYAFITFKITDREHTEFYRDYFKVNWSKILPPASS